MPAWDGTEGEGKIREDCYSDSATSR